MGVLHPITVQIILCLTTVLSSLVYLSGLSRTFSQVDKYSSTANPYLSEMYFDNQDQKALYKEGWFPESSKKVFIYLVDGLRYDQVVNLKQIDEISEDQSKFSPGPFSSIIDKLNEESEKSVLLRGIVDTQTMTITRIKALTTGTIPSFMSMFDQLAMDAQIQDNLFYQWKNRPNETIYLYGVNLWNQYFSKYFDMQRLNENSNLQSMIDNSQVFQEEVIEKHLKGNQQNWTLLIEHDAGMDSLMHGELIYRYEKPFESEPYLRAVNISNNGGREFMRLIDNDTILIIFSDHGFSNYGTHGGRDYEETRSVIFGYNKHGFIKDQNISQLMDTKGLNAETDQIDLLATICMLKGLPIPSNNLGVIIPDFFLNKPFITDRVIANAYYTNARQIEDYFEESYHAHTVPAYESYQEIKETAKTIRKAYTSLFDIKVGLKESQQGQLAQFIKKVINFSQLAKKIARTEAKNNLSFMTLATTMLILIIFLACRFISTNPSQDISGNSFRLLNSTLVRFILGFLAFHAIVFSLLTTVSFLLLISLMAILTIFVLLVDSFFWKKDPILQQVQGQQSSLALSILANFKKHCQWYLVSIFSVLFLNSTIINHLDSAFGLLLGSLLALFTIQTYLDIKLTSIQKHQILMKILTIFICILLGSLFDPFLQRDLQKYSQKWYIFQILINLLSLELFNTLIPLVLFGIFYYSEVRNVIVSPTILRKQKRVISLIFISFYLMLFGYFSGKSHFLQDSSFFRNFFPHACYLLLITLGLTLGVYSVNFTFLQKYKLLLLGILPSFLFLMDRNSITLVILFFHNIDLFTEVISLLGYNRKALIPAILTIMAFQFFFASGHKLAFEFMHLQTHSTGLLIHNDFFSNVNVFLCNYAWFFLAFLSLPVQINYCSEYPAFSVATLNDTDKELSNLTDYLKNKNQDQSSTTMKHQANTGDSTLLRTISILEKSNDDKVDSSIKLNVLKFGLENQQLYLWQSLPITLALATTFIRNMYLSQGELSEQYSTFIVFLTTIFLISCLFTGIHSYLQKYYEINGSIKVEGKDH